MLSSLDLTCLGYTKYRLSPIITNGKRLNESFTVWVGSGTLINQWYVLTAAHLLRSKKRRIRTVRLGDWLVKDDPYDRSGEEEGTELPDPQVRRGVIAVTQLISSYLALLGLPSG